MYSTIHLSWREISGAATYASLACFIFTIAISFVTKPKPESELAGLVYGVSDRAKEEKVDLV